jgi:hypothetical protein
MAARLIRLSNAPGRAVSFVAKKKPRNMIQGLNAS